MPIFEHGQAQGRLFGRFDQLRITHALYPSVEQRLRVAEGIYRVVDVAVFAGAKPNPVPAAPPLVIAEVLSPDERWSNLMERLEEYASFGVPNIWLVDLERKALLLYQAGDIVRTEAFRLAGYPLEIRFRDLSE